MACLRARSVLLQLLPSLRDCTKPHEPQPLRDQTQARLPGSEPRLCHPHWGISASPSNCVTSHICQMLIPTVALHRAVAKTRWVAVWG